MILTLKFAGLACCWSDGAKPDDTYQPAFELSCRLAGPSPGAEVGVGGRDPTQRREHERRAPRAERAIKRRRHGYYREHQNVCDHRRYLQPYEHSDKRRYETEYPTPYKYFFIVQHLKIVALQREDANPV